MGHSMNETSRMGLKQQPAMEDIRLVGSGAIGGKASGFLRAKRHLEKKEVCQSVPELASLIRFPVTACVTTECFDTFVEKNNLSPLIQKYKWNEETAYDQLRGYFLSGKFTGTTKDALREILKEITYPLAVRSSSLLEDRKGTSFAGKYRTTD